MAAEITIFGKQTWPFTTKAREAKGNEGVKVVYRDVIQDSEALEEMLRLTQGERRVPVLVTGDQVTIGFGGSWRV